MKAQGLFDHLVILVDTYDREKCHVKGLIDDQTHVTQEQMVQASLLADYKRHTQQWATRHIVWVRARREEVVAGAERGRRACRLFVRDIRTYT